MDSIPAVDHDRYHCFDLILSAFFLAQNTECCICKLCSKPAFLPSPQCSLAFERKFMAMENMKVGKGRAMCSTRTREGKRMLKKIC